MSSLVGAMAQEWEFAMHNAAKAAQLQQWNGQQQAQRVVEASETAEKPAVKELHIVQDLVEDITDKPEGS